MHIHFIQHVPFEYPGSILDWAAEKRHTTAFTKVFDGDAFPVPGQFDMLVILGGPMGVYEENIYPWMTLEKQCIKAAIEADKKVLGVCLGSQFIANVLGEEVYAHTQKEIGWWPVQKIGEHPLTAGLPTEFITFHWHGDTFRLPKGTVQLFRSAVCEQQGFIYNNHAAGVQFHIEVKQDLLDGMTEHESNELTGEGYVQTAETIKQHIAAEIPRQNNYMKAFLDNFEKL
ncbi:MAG TPA: type 1 glutamine amidotransferase [Chitinophagaceae bacterium]|nr:type 1 glutamine amidotransferase [Chitinophagaceae bacterium]